MATDLKTEQFDVGVGEINKYDFRNDEKYIFKSRKGLDEQIVHQISDMKNEPQWMRDFRLKSLEIFNSKPMPRWGGAIDLNFQDIFYYIKPSDHQGRSWDDVPDDIKRTFDKLGIPEAERKFLAGVGAQYESEVVYHQVREDLEIGVVNCNGTILAIEDRCSHDNGILFEGDIDVERCTVECPRHGSLFDLATGKPLNLPAYVPVDTFEVVVEDDMIRVEVD
jgi:Fe-S cluster assembly protein SufB